MKLTILSFIAAAIVLLALAAFAQVVPPAPGVDLPQSYFDRIAQDPTAFQFQKAWIEKARKAKELREAVLAAQPEGMSLASLPDELRQSMMVSGTTYVPVLMGKFSNTGADPYPIASLQTKLFSPPGAASMTSLYREMSYTNLNLTGTVYGWYPVSNIDTYYEGAAGCYGLCGTAKTGQFIKEILQMADPAVNFGTYDNDGPDGIPNSGDDDGFVDFVAIVQPEIGAECGGNNNIWSHRWVVQGWPEFGGNPWTTNDARSGGGFIQVEDYTIQPALGSVGGCGAGIIEIGVFCHEFGHAYGLPDLYDGSGSAGIGYWGLMGSGNWNTPTNPAHLDAWCKSQLGWIVPTEVGPVSQLRSIRNSEVNAEAYKLAIMEEKFSRRNVNPIAGSWSMRCMLTSTEATARNWPGGAGYGNGWDEAVERSFAYNGANPVNLQYDYAYDSEPDYDFTYVTIKVNSTVSTLYAYNGTSGSGHANFDLTPYLNGSGATSYTLRFQFASDTGWSDEDYFPPNSGYNSGTNGAFKFDNVSVTGGGVSYSTGFETYEDGWHYDRTKNPTTEYFLVENRNTSGAQFDQALRGQGLVIYHVEQDVMAPGGLGNTGGSSNNVARGMMLEEADNLSHLRNNTNRGEAGDVFPGSTNNMNFNGVTSPKSWSLNNVATNGAAETIGSPGATMTAYLRGGYLAPALVSIAPNTGNNNGAIAITDLLGDNFIHGATFFLRSGTNPYGAGTSAWVGHAKLTGTLNLYAVPGGVYNVVVRNPDGQEAVLAGGFTVVDVLTGIESPGVLVNALHQNHPNPFNPTTTIRYSIKTRGHVTLAIYNAAGQRVRTLVDEIQSPEAAGFSVMWDGKNDSGSQVASGVYLYKLTAGNNYQAVKKLVLLK
jgi:M6 family metalloprotease-like protein